MASTCAFTTPSPLVVDKSYHLIHSQSKTPRLKLRQRRFPITTNTTTVMSSYTATGQALIPCLNRFLRTIPFASGENHKGSHGRVGIIGGSETYTGAPYYAAMAVLRGGGDLSYVFAHKEAAKIIKGYSPELMVEADWQAYGPRLYRGNLHAVVVGCGMGREGKGRDVIESLVVGDRGGHEVPIVIDADGLYWLKEGGIENALKSIESAKAPVVFTPNVRELQGLERVATDTDENENVIMLTKGRVDEVRWKGETIQVHERGTERRFGGQGDVLAGLCGLFCAWAHLAGAGAGGMRDAAVAASFLARRAARGATIRKRRATSALDMLDFVGSTVDELIEGPIKPENQL